MNWNWVLIGGIGAAMYWRHGFDGPVLSLGTGQIVALVIAAFLCPYLGEFMWGFVRGFLTNK